MKDNEFTLSKSEHKKPHLILHQPTKQESHTLFTAVPNAVNAEVFFFCDATAQIGPRPPHCLGVCLTQLRIHGHTL